MLLYKKGKKTVVPPPKSIVAKTASKPFTELSMTMQKSEHSNVVQYKYLHMLIQEFAIRLDQGLINSLITMFATEAASGPYNKESFLKDIEFAKPHLLEKAVSTTASQQKAFYDDLHISPLMIHLSFSQGGVAAGHGHDSNQKGTGKDEQGGVNIQSEFINVLLKSVGVSLTEIQDVVFRLAFFERRYAFYSVPQLQAEIKSHYTMQLVKQLYVLVLGLNIIGNPFGLVRNLSAGVEDLFYQPFQGAIQGPEEFAEGLALGVTSLFGHAVGGTAGAFSRITGTLGKGIAVLTFDEDYQRKRQEALNRRPTNFGEGLFRATKDLGLGFFNGVTGIFVKPYEGARRRGFKGFVKGVGQGMIGVVTRPISGIVDFTSNSLDAVKTAAGKNEDIRLLRPRRFIPRDQIVRPYNYSEAVGFKFFRDTDRGKFVDTCNFIIHGLISEKLVFIVTDKCVFLTKRQTLLGTWVDEWVYMVSEIESVKKIDNGICLEIKKRNGDPDKKNGKILVFNTSNISNRIFNRLEMTIEQSKL
uniref:Vacuolar protein sorting-associated protein 13 DH-like domain-containing protein n=1 Tax=Panagrolaimus sp. JU765 TaxID=591449 RepID=A0AC34QPZ6_9BILA